LKDKARQAKTPATEESPCSNGTKKILGEKITLLSFSKEDNLRKRGEASATVDWKALFPESGERTA